MSKRKEGGWMSRGWRLAVWLMLCSHLLWPGVAAAADENFIDNKDGTISDLKQGLMWQKADDGVQRSWQEAMSYCESLELAGHSDWVLPKAQQLEALIDTNNSPTINPVFSVKASYYWTATGSTTSGDTAKYVNFFYGNTYTYNKGNPYYALCVRESELAKSRALTVVFTGVPVQDTPLSIRFTPKVTGGKEPYFYEWEFGDGGTSGATEPTHKFDHEGTYKVMLTVSDDAGDIAGADQEITLPLANISAAAPAEKPVEATSKVTKEEKSAAEVVSAVPAAGETPGTSAGGGAGTASAIPAGGKIRGVIDVSASGQAPPYKGGALGHGLLAYAFANAMAGDGDLNKDGAVTASELQGYLDQAIKTLSNGRQSPVIARDDLDFPVCAANGSTFVFAIGIDRNLNGDPLTAGQDAEFVRKAVEDRCRDTKTLMLTGSHASRQDILQALLQIGSMVTTNDTMVVYLAGANNIDNGRLNWYVSDTKKELPAFTGIYHDDLIQFLTNLPLGHLLVLGEKN